MDNAEIIQYCTATVAFPRMCAPKTLVLILKWDPMILKVTSKPFSQQWGWPYWVRESRSGRVTSTKVKAKWEILQSVLSSRYLVYLNSWQCLTKRESGGWQSKPRKLPCLFSVAWILRNISYHAARPNPNQVHEKGWVYLERGSTQQPLSNAQLPIHHHLVREC